MNNQTATALSLLEVHAPVRHLVRHVAALIRAAARWQRQRQAMRDIEGLDDRMLRDIGLHRTHAYRAVTGRPLDDWSR
jgi:uncharacterized protein YjiS (DUF1127 family)